MVPIDDILRAGSAGPHRAGQRSHNQTGWHDRDGIGSGDASTAFLLELAPVTQSHRGLILPDSDTGSEYACHDYQKLLVKHGMICSMKARKATAGTILRWSDSHTGSVKRRNGPVIVGTNPQEASRCREYVAVSTQRLLPLGPYLNTDP